MLIACYCRRRSRNGEKWGRMSVGLILKEFPWLDSVVRELRIRLWWMTNCYCHTCKANYFPSQFVTMYVDYRGRAPKVYLQTNLRHSSPLPQMLHGNMYFPTLIERIRLMVLKDANRCCSARLSGRFLIMQ